MTLEYFPIDKIAEEPGIEFIFEGRKKEKFEKKIAGYLQSLFQEFPVLKEFRYKITSHNTFPHSTGIASSASSMSALGLCLAELLNRLAGIAISPSDHLFLQQASRFARLASGSACRSLFGGFVIWGEVPRYAGTSNEYAVPFPFGIHKEMQEMRDSILVVSSKEKEVSSRAGHSLMESNPYASQRYQQAMTHIHELSDSITTGDFDKFILITESEAMTLHAMMMTSNPSYFLFEPNTVSVINKIRQFRNKTSIPVCFTLDAGPNVHLVYPVAYENKVKNWIIEEIEQYCEEGKWIDDEIGVGPQRNEN
jgi:diphosphomevalonate decarboxylase